jgi:hypothetical protein
MGHTSIKLKQSKLLSGLVLIENYKYAQKKTWEVKHNAVI